MPRARLADVAERAGVSPATASLVLRDRPGPSAQARATVRRVAHELGYRPDPAASTLASRSSSHIGVLLHLSSTFHADLADALDAAAHAAGFDLVLTPVTTRRREWESLETLLSSRCAGLVLLGPTLAASTLRRVGAELPVVVVGRGPCAGVTAVHAAESVGMTRAVEHLVGLGHRRITLVDGPRDVIATARRRGYRAAMAAAGLDEHAEVVTGGADEEAGLAAGRALLDRLGSRQAGSPEAGAEQPSAVVAFNDRVAVGVRVALARGGVRVPEEMSVVGYDDSPLARLATVDLTTVSQNPRALARESIAALQRGIAGEPGPAEVAVTPSLVVRSTTAPPHPRRSPS